MMRKEQFQICQEISQELEIHGFKIIEQSDLFCKMAWQGWQLSISFQNILAKIEQEPKQRNILILQFVQQI